MAVRDIVKGKNNEALRKISREVRQITPHILTLLDDMRDTLHAEEGVGLAAPQVGVLRRIAVVEYDEKYYEMINPRIIGFSGEAVEEEGCLSIPGIRGRVKRPESVTAKYIDRHGKRRKVMVTGIAARGICHEIDHLDGVLFVDKMLKENE
jgi:peptide deformylase